MTSQQTTQRAARLAFPTLCGLLLAWLMPGICQAGRPLNTDDAAILAPGDCQLESWWQQSANVRQQVLAPACNWGGGVEWGASLTGAQGPARSAPTQVGLQAKTVLREIGVGDWGAGISAGLSRALSGRQEEGTTQTAAALLSIAPREWLQLHMNLGATRNAVKPLTATWAAAVDYSLGARWTLSLEAFGERHGRPTQQLGARVWLLQDRLQLDASLGREPVTDDRPGRRLQRIASLGLVWVWSGR